MADANEFSSMVNGRLEAFTALEAAGASVSKENKDFIDVEFL